MAPPGTTLNPTNSAAASTSLMKTNFTALEAENRLDLAPGYAPGGTSGARTSEVRAAGTREVVRVNTTSIKTETYITRGVSDVHTSYPPAPAQTTGSGTTPAAPAQPKTVTILDADGNPREVEVLDPVAASRARVAESQRQVQGNVWKNRENNTALNGEIGVARRVNTLEGIQQDGEIHRSNRANQLLQSRRRGQSRSARDILDGAPILGPLEGSPRGNGGGWQK